MNRFASSGTPEPLKRKGPPTGKQPIRRRARSAIVALALAAMPAAGFPAFAQSAPGLAAQSRPLPPASLPIMNAPLSAASPPVAASAIPSGSVGNLPHDLSPWSMFLNADVVVKAVMVGLGFASLVTWTIWLAKSLQLVGARRRAARGVRALVKADSLAHLTPRRGALRSGPVAALIHAAEHETARSASLPPEGVKERAAIALGRVEARAARAMTRGTGLIATIGSTAPFVGLFGTVWGIMNSFVGISQSHTTNLAVVAPGIAEALLATATGLVAAIPAVVIYNVFARGIAGYKALLSDASAEVMRHLSRDLDRRLHPAE